MLPILVAAFLICLGVIILVIVLSVILCIISDAYRYKDLQRRLKKERDAAMILQED